MSQLDGENSPLGGMIGCLTYQSRAVQPPSEGELDALVARARARNHSLGVTGLLLYEDGRYLQTLEGPPEGLSQVWSSIRQDERHSDIELLTEHLVSSRLFSEWDLLLYRKLEPLPKTLREKLRRKHPLARHVQAAAKHAFEADERALNELFAMLKDKGWGGDELAKHLIEPTARAMGDAWLDDMCSEFDLTLGLGMLQMAGHAVRYSDDPNGIRTSQYTILLAAAPGEPHMLGASLLADQFSDAGWRVDMAFPGSSEALANQLGDQHPDVVDISLSEALPRHGRLAALRETVKQCREANPEEPLVVSVGGRLFAEAIATAEHVGADHARQTTAGTRIKMANLVRSSRAPTRIS